MERTRGERTRGEEDRGRWRLVVAVDGSEGSAEALTWAARVAPLMGAEVIAVHALQRPVFAGGYVPWAFGMGSSPEAWDAEWRQWGDRIREQLAGGWCRPLRDAGVDHRAVVIEGGAYELLAYAREVGGDLLIVGRRGLGGFRELLVGSFSHQLIHHSPIPVLVVPRHETDAEDRDEPRSAVASNA